MGDMAIVKATYTKSSTGAKASIRYIEHRPGKDGAAITRNLFNSDGLMGRWEAYRMIDEAERGTIFYRLILNFDAEKEDTHKDLYMQEITEQTMFGLEQRLGTQVQWVAATHADHTPLRHVHIVAILPHKLQRQDLYELRQLATEQALVQRQERDLAREQQEQSKEAAQWER